MAVCSLLSISFHYIGTEQFQKRREENSSSINFFVWTKIYYVIFYSIPLTLILNLTFPFFVLLSVFPPFNNAETSLVVCNDFYEIEASSIFMRTRFHFQFVFYQIKKQFLRYKDTFTKCITFNVMDALFWLYFFSSSVCIRFSIEY